MDSLLLVSLLYEVVGKKEFQEGLIDLVFKEAKNKVETGDNKYIQIPEGVSKIEYGVFWDCNNLTTIIIPDSVTSIGEYAFRNCYNLTSITIPNSVISIGYFTFGCCKSLTSIKIPSSTS